jgi:hypothetical protein
VSYTAAMMRSALCVTLALGLTASFGTLGCGDDASAAGGDGGADSSVGGAGGDASAGGAGAGGASGGEAPVDQLHRYLTGRFDSADQSMSEPEYFAVQLEACPVVAPELGERVLYIEQAVMTSLDAPYRQRLYVVQPGADPSTQAVSVVYELADPAAFVGACSEATPRDVTAAEAIERAGCEVLVDVDGSGGFVGGTQGTDCESSLQGASYATSEVTITQDLIASWDRGYDASGNQVWGAVSGAYHFVRRTPVPEP